MRENSSVDVLIRRFAFDLPFDFVSIVSFKNIRPQRWFFVMWSMLFFSTLFPISRKLSACKMDRLFSFCFPCLLI